MTQENQERIDNINLKIDAIKKQISKVFDNTERARLDCEVKKYMKEIEEIKKSEKKKPETVLRIDDPTFLDRKAKGNKGPAGNINSLGGRNYSVNI